MRRWKRITVAAGVAVAPIVLIGGPAHAATVTALWHMEDPTTMADSSGNGNTGVPTAVTSVSGLSENGYHFDGTASGVTVGDSATLDPGTSDFSFTVHVRFASAPTAAVVDYDLMRKGLAGTIGGEFKMEIDPPSVGSPLATPYCHFQDSTGKTASIRDTHNLADDAWHEITCVKTSSAIQVVVDGVALTQSVQLGSIANNKPLEIGMKTGGGDQYLGDMDEVSMSVGSLPPPTDSTPPTVTSRSPASGATGISVSAVTTATFSEPVQGVDTNSFTLTGPDGQQVAATVAQSGTTNKWILDPVAKLASGTTYTATLTGGPTAIRDLAGNPLADTPWSFTTAADTTAPTVTARSPRSGATGVSPGAMITATFSEPVQGVDTSSFTLTGPGGQQVAATVAQSGTTNKWILDPVAKLASRTTYTATLTGGTAGIRDLAGNPLAGTTTWSFTTK